MINEPINWNKTASDTDSLNTPLTPLRVSVIIPVYNAGLYVREAVESALAQPETAEILIVEDNSTDDSLEVCRQLEVEHTKVHLLRHPNGANRGAGMSRNLGIIASKSDCVAFLDADDVYLSNRFSAAISILAKQPEVDGVYEAVGVLVGDDADLDQWEESDLGIPTLTTIKSRLKPEELFDALVSDKQLGHIHLNGLLVRKSLFAKTGLFSGMRFHQDTEMLIRMAGVGRLVSGVIDRPIAKRRIHSGNRIVGMRSQDQVYTDRFYLGKTVYWWCRQHLSSSSRSLAADYWTRYGMFTPRGDALSRLPRPLQVTIRFCTLPFYAPELLFEPAYYLRLWKYWWNAICKRLRIRSRGKPG